MIWILGISFAIIFAGLGYSLFLEVTGNITKVSGKTNNTKIGGNKNGKKNS